MEEIDIAEAAWTREPSAQIDEGAAIGARSRLWHQAHVRSGARVGSDCSIGKNVYVDTGVTIGDRVKVQNNVSVYQGVTVGDDAFLGPSCVFTNDLYPRASNASWQVTPTRVGTGASIGANATVVCGHDIGDWAVVGAGAVVTRDVEAHQLVLGNPARPRGWVCRCGRVVSRDADVLPPTFECDSCAETAP